MKNKIGYLILISYLTSKLIGLGFAAGDHNHEKKEKVEKTKKKEAHAHGGEEEGHGHGGEEEGHGHGGEEEAHSHGGEEEGHGHGGEEEGHGHGGEEEGHGHGGEEEAHSHGGEEEGHGHGGEEEGHGHGEEGSKAVGEGKAIEAVDETKGFKLSKEAVKTLKLMFKPYSGKKFNISKKSLVAFKNEKGIYRLRDGFYKFIDIKIIQKVNGGFLIEAKDMGDGDQYVSDGVGLLRISDVYSTDKSNYGHSH